MIYYIDISIDCLLEKVFMMKYIYCLKNKRSITVRNEVNMWMSFDIDTRFGIM